MFGRIQNTISHHEQSSVFSGLLNHPLLHYSHSSSIWVQSGARVSVQTGSYLLAGCGGTGIWTHTQSHSFILGM